MSESRKTIKLKSKKENQNKSDENNNTGRKLDKKYLKLKFNKNLLIEILKKSRLRRMSEKKKNAKNSSSSRFHNFNKTEKPLYSKDKIINKIYQNFQDFPEMKKFHNITLEKLTNLITSNEETDKSSQYSKFRFNNMNLKIKPEDNNINSYRKKFQNLTNIKKSNFNYFKNTEQYAGGIHQFPKYTSTDIKNINLNDLNLNKDNMLPLLSTKSNESIPITTKYSSLSKTKKNIIQNKAITPKKKFMSKASKEYQTNKWLESIRDSIKKYDILHRSSRIDRLIFVIENPEGCFEENLMEEKPGDKYIMLKNQMIRHKDKFENIIREIKLNQKKSEYLMKKYIFDLLSRKKSVYKG